MAHFYPQGLLLLVLITVISECRGGSPLTVFGSQEGDVVLPCFDSNVTDQKSCYRFKLIKYATDATQLKVILARPKTSKIQDAERVKWEANGNGQMSLSLTKLQKSDEGLYSCEIWQGWDCTLVKNISLKVKECKALQSVKAAPSMPVNLNCPVDTTSGQQGPRNISWAMLKGGNPVSVEGSKRLEINGTSLAIQSVSFSDSGWYSCKYVLGQTQRCFDIYLLVQEVEILKEETSVEATTIPALTVSKIILKTRKEGSSGAFIAVVASAIIGTAITAALIGLYIYCRRNSRRVTHLAQRHPPGAILEAFGAYETVNLTLPSDVPANQRVNSLYQQIEDESMCTFPANQRVNSLYQQIEDESMCTFHY